MYDDLTHAENFWIRVIQAEYFSEEIETIKRKKCISKGSKIANVQPFIDEDNILRAEG